MSRGIGSRFAQVALHTAKQLPGSTVCVSCVIGVMFTLAGGVVCAAAPLPAMSKPNVLVILVDDMGYSDLGCYGGEIKTPNLDALAHDGLRFTQFYNTARCWPTRSALLTGYYAQEIRRDKVPGIKSGGAGVRPPWAPLLPMMLRPLGYRSYHSGKWHVDGQPIKNGFDHSYYLQDMGRFFSPRRHSEDGVQLPPVKPDSGYYATIQIADYAIKFLKDHARNYAGMPFFEFVAFNAPHFPLHALQTDIDRYRDRYLCGWEQIRKERHERQLEMGIVSCSLSAVERDLGPPYDFPKAFEILGPGEVKYPLPWSELTETQRKFQAIKMAIHAAMVDRMDQEVGRIINQLKEMNAFDDTLIFFLSDNGASAEIMVRDDGHDPKAAPGSAMTHLCLGPGWSTSCNTPFRRHKTWEHEGGPSTPLIVHWPARIHAKDELRTNPGHVVDLVPTILAVAGGAAPATWEGHVRPTPPGVSLVPVFAKDGTVKHDYLWWLHEDNRAIRVGDWKLVSDYREGKWELYDLSLDRAESNNLIEQYPEKARELQQVWQKHYDEFLELAKRDLPPESKAGKKAKRKNNKKKN